MSNPAEVPLHDPMTPAPMGPADPMMPQGQAMAPGPLDLESVAPMAEPLVPPPPTTTALGPDVYDDPNQPARGYYNEHGQWVY